MKNIGRIIRSAVRSVAFSGVFIVGFLAIVASSVACDRGIGFLPQPAKRFICVGADGKMFFDGVVTEIEWASSSSSRVSFKDVQGKIVMLHVPAQVCAVTDVPPPVSPPVPTAPVPVASTDAGPSPASRP